MTVLSVQNEFQSGDNVTATSLNNLVNQANFNADTTDSSTLEVHSSGYLKVKDNGIQAQHLKSDADDTNNNQRAVTTNHIRNNAITSAKIAANAVDSSEIASEAVTTAKIENDAVTLAKLQNIATSKVIGRTSAGDGDPELIDIKDDDAMANASATALATQQSIKAYVDNNGGNEVAILTGVINTGATIPLPDGYTQAQCAWMVAVGNVVSNHGDHNANHNLTMTANSDRVVTTTGIGTGSGSANYMIIGVK
jgi:hypothetical protein